MLSKLTSKIAGQIRKETRQNTLFLLLVLGVFLIGYVFFINRMGVVADEWGHCRRIIGILKGIDRFPIDCPYLPTYHWTLAILYWMTHFHTPGAHEFLPLCASSSIFLFPSMMRLLSSVLAFACFVSFFFLAKTIRKDSAFQKASLFLFFPLSFPFFFLIYTDIYAMFYVFLAFLLALNQRLWFAGMVGILSCLVRQNNIVWVVFIALIVYVENDYPQHRLKNIKTWIAKYSFFFLALILMAIFVIWNKGFIVADKQHHYVVFNFNYVFFMLFLFFFLFLPQNFGRVKPAIAFLKQRKWMWFILAALYFVYLFSFNASHEYNTDPLFLHNKLLIWMSDPSPLVRTFAFLPIAFSILLLCVTRLQRKSFYWLYPFSLLFIIPSAVIEIRYLFIPFMLFILFKERDSERTFFITLIFYFITIACLISAMQFFFP
jgi:alpha-1,2-glucosyltransferase